MSTPLTGVGLSLPLHRTRGMGRDGYEHSSAVSLLVHVVGTVFQLLFNFLGYLMEYT